MNRGDKIRSMTNEEMASYIRAHVDCENCPFKRECRVQRTSRAGLAEMCINFARKWLNTPIFKPCPFCGSESIECAKLEGGLKMVMCISCGARTDEFANEKTAADAWNRRIENAD